MSNYKKPLPLITPVSHIFYEGCQNGKLLYQQCSQCGEVIFFPKSLCPECLSHNIEWKESAGKGRIFTYTVTYANAPPEFISDMPYVLAIVRMDEGYKLMTNIVDCDFADLQCDLSVEVIFEKVTEAITLPKFRLLGKAATS